MQEWDPQPPPAGSWGSECLVLPPLLPKESQTATPSEEIKPTKLLRLKWYTELKKLVWEATHLPTAPFSVHIWVDAFSRISQIVSCLTQEAEDRWRVHEGCSRARGVTGCRRPWVCSQSFFTTERGKEDVLVVAQKDMGSKEREFKESQAADKTDKDKAEEWVVVKDSRPDDLPPWTRFLMKRRK